MINGLNSSTISLALRTAQRAEKTVSKTVEQIASGKKVASVKDDGAAYVRASAFMSDSKQWETRKQILDLVEVDLEATHLVALEQTRIMENLQNILVQARSYAIGSNSRIQLQSQWNQLIEEAGTFSSPVNSFPNAAYVASGYNSGIDLSNDTYLSDGGRYFVQPSLGLDFTGGTNPIALSSVNIVTASNTTLDDAYTTTNNNLGNLPSGGTYLNLRITESMRDLNRAEKLEEFSEVMTQRNQDAISSLTDIDMGKVSRDRDLAQSRQQLAYQTVQNAIAHYSNVSRGLLNNVMGTQRSVRA